MSTSSSSKLSPTLKHLLSLNANPPNLNNSKTFNHHFHHLLTDFHHTATSQKLKHDTWMIFTVEPLKVFFIINKEPILILTFCFPSSSFLLLFHSQPRLSLSTVLVPFIHSGIPFVLILDLMHMKNYIKPQV